MIYSRFKDGKPYPWSSETLSSLILYPEAANQTIYTRNAGKIDQGKYVCVLRNDTHKSEQYIDLQVKSEFYFFCNLMTSNCFDFESKLGGFFSENRIERKKHSGSLISKVDFYSIIKIEFAINKNQY